MKINQRLLKLLTIILLLCPFIALAESPNTTESSNSAESSNTSEPSNTDAVTDNKNKSKPVIKHVKGTAEDRKKKEEKIPANSFAGTFYKPTYILPYYYTGSPDNAVYQNHTPNNEQLKHQEMKFQLSFKVPLWKNILNHPSSLYFAYTQLTYWQLYNNSAFIRETDYEPEFFLANEINFHLINDWNINFLNLGAVHQSNGRGGSLERSWNRIYLEAISSTDHWLVSLKPWYVIQDGTLLRHNSNITNYLGYGRILIGYKYNGQLIALSMHNIVEGGGKRATAELTWSFPITSYLKGYAQVFSGYGQSLIEYNHRTNSVGVGVAFSDWV